MKASAANGEPECEMNAMGPGSRWSGVGKPVARRLRSRLRNPIPLPPQRAIPCSRAIAPSRSISTGLPGSGASYSEEKITADRAPASAAERSASSWRALATPRIARSTGSPMSATEG